MSLCSNCSAPVEPIVAIDIDGTLAEYHQHLIDHIVNYWGLGVDDVPVGRWNGVGNFEDFIGISQDQYREAKLAFRQGGYKRWAPVRDGVTGLANTVNHLRKRYGLEVWITTTRPWNRLDSTDPDTRFWLDRHFPMYDHLLYHDHKYPELARILDGGSYRVVAILEDLPEMWAEAAETFGSKVPYMIQRPHNQVYRREVRPQSVTSIDAFSRTLITRVEKWNRQHATAV